MPVAQHRLDDPHCSFKCVATDHGGVQITRGCLRSFSKHVNNAYLEICRLVSLAFYRYIAYEPDIEITDKLQTARAQPTISWCSYPAVCIF